MTSLRLRFATAAAVATLAISSIVPAQAGPMPVAPVSPAVQSSSDVTDVQYRRHWRDDHRRDYYNGHRGYRDRRPGYRYHNGMWFPLAAFGAGAIIGGAIASQPRGSSHISWCESRYRTYRASDNTYVASGGVRRTCVSPN